MAGASRKELAPATYAKAVWSLETLVYRYIGSRPIAKLSAADVRKLPKRIEGRGIPETAHRTRQPCSQVFPYAVQTERAAHKRALRICKKLPSTGRSPRGGRESNQCQRH
jgi:integrase